MGYTHYWTFNGQASRQGIGRYNKALKAISQLVYEYSQKHGGISGFTAHTKPGQYAGVGFNGSRENSHENFVLRETLALNEAFNFCKTARKPYDILVVASLCLLQDIMGRYVVVSSDGQYPDWAAGAELASKFLGRTVSVPVGIRRTSQRHLKLVS